jgi:hypothetical protein
MYICQETLQKAILLVQDQCFMKDNTSIPNLPRLRAHRISGLRFQLIGPLPRREIVSFIRFTERCLRCISIHFHLIRVNTLCDF